MVFAVPPNDRPNQELRFPRIYMKKPPISPFTQIGNDGTSQVRSPNGFQPLWWDFTYQNWSRLVVNRINES